MPDQPEDPKNLKEEFERKRQREILLPPIMEFRAKSVEKKPNEIEEKEKKNQLLKNANLTNIPGMMNLSCFPYELGSEFEQDYQYLAERNKAFLEYVDFSLDKFYGIQNSRKKPGNFLELKKKKNPEKLFKSYANPYK